MRIIRRISAAFKDIPGGQLLGATYDYTHRLIHFESENENSSELSERFKQILAEQAPEKIKFYDRVSSLLKKEGLIDTYDEDNTPPCDVTEKLLEFPAARSARLQTMTRADTGFLSGLSYSVLRGFGQVHPLSLIHILKFCSAVLIKAQRLICCPVNAMLLPFAILSLLPMQTM